jgi:four helix bundle protein
MTPKELRARTAEFARVINRLCAPLLAVPAARQAAAQLLDSSSSTASNHRAAGRARSHAEFTAKIGIAAEEADENVFWLEHLRDCGLVAAADIESHLTEARELSAIFTASARTARLKDQEDREARAAKARRRNRRR